MDVATWTELFTDRTRLLHGRVTPLRLDGRGGPFALVEVVALPGELPPLPYAHNTKGRAALKASVAAGETTLWSWYGQRCVRVAPWPGEVRS